MNFHPALAAIILATSFAPCHSNFGYSNLEFSEDEPEEPEQPLFEEVLDYEAGELPPDDLPELLELPPDNDLPELLEFISSFGEFGGRRLHGAVDVSFSKCAEERYNLSVLVTGAHVALSAAPDCEAPLRTTNCQQCPGFLFHAKETSVEEGQVPHLEKVIHKISPKGWRKEYTGLDLGTFELGKMHQAFNMASIDTDKEYSLFANNCASLAINMGRNLGIDPTDDKIVKYVSRNLSNNAPSIIMNELTEHEDGLAMIGAHEDEDAVIEAFVSAYIHKSV